MACTPELDEFDFASLTNGNAPAILILHKCSLHNDPIGKDALVKKLVAHAQQWFLPSTLSCSTHTCFDELCTALGDASTAAQKTYDAKRVQNWRIVVADDCVKTKRDWRNPTLHAIVMNHRHFAINFIVTAELDTGLIEIPPEMRCNFDFVFVIGDGVDNPKKILQDNYAQQRLWQRYMGSIETFATAKAAIKEHVSETSFICIDNTSSAAAKTATTNVFHGSVRERGATIKPCRRR